MLDCRPYSIPTLGLFLLTTFTQMIAAQTVTGSGTSGTVPKFTGASTLGNSIITVNAANVGIGIPIPQRELHVNGLIRVDRNLDSAAFMLHRTGLKTFLFGVTAGAVNTGDFFISDLGSATAGGGIRRFTIGNTGNVGIGVDAPAYKLSVAGTIQCGFRRRK